MYHHSQDIRFRSPFGAVPCETKVTLRIEADAQEVTLRCWVDDKEQLYPMRYEDGLFEATVAMPQSPCLFWYFFIADGHVYYGNNDRNLGGEGMLYPHEPPSFQITVYEKTLHTPDWFKESIVYQIFVDRFFRSGTVPKKQRKYTLLDWDTPVPYDHKQDNSEFAKNYFYGGNLNGIIEKMPYLKELGVTTLYLNPIFEAYSNHKYDTADYLKIDPMFGTEETFQQLCASGLHMILDGVFNHTGADSIYFNRYGNYDSKGACQGQDSPYYYWYHFYHFCDHYSCWWGIPTLPAINKNNADFQRFITQTVIKKWLRLGASGFRLDVADELSDEMLNQIHHSMKEENSENVVIGEVWEDASNKISYGQKRSYLFGKQLDGVMNYPFKDAIVSFILGKMDAPNFGKEIMSIVENYPVECLQASMNLLGSHDVMRIKSVFGEPPHLPKEQQGSYQLTLEQEELAKKRLRLAVLLQMTFLGVPTIYYGDEIGMQGLEDPFNRAPFDWKHIDEETHSYYRNLISIRKNNPVFVYGSFEIEAAAGSFFAFRRKMEGVSAYIAVNVGPAPAELMGHFIPPQSGKLFLESSGALQEVELSTKKLSSNGE